MSLEDTISELIDQYIQGELPNDHPFVQRLLQDQELAMEVEVRKMVESAVVKHRLLEVEKLLVNKRKEVQKVETSKKKWGNLVWPLIALLGGTSVYFYFSESKKENVIEISTLPVKEHEVQQAPKALIMEQKTSSIINTKSKKIANVEPLLSPENTAENNFLPQKEDKPVTLPEPEPISTVSAIERKAEKVQTSQSVSTLPANPCEGIRLRAFIEEQRPCAGNSQGQLTLKGVRGGKAPYQYSIEGKPYQEEDHFAGLKEGDYTVAIKDANGCETTVYEKFSLRSKSCSSLSEHVFNPHFGFWEVPNHKEKQGTLTIHDLNGQTTYSKAFDKDEKLTWGGTRNSGELLIPGAYLYSIKYSDGEIEQGKITITY